MLHIDIDMRMIRILSKKSRPQPNTTFFKVQQSKIVTGIPLVAQCDNDKKMNIKKAENKVKLTKNEINCWEQNG